MKKVILGIFTAISVLFMTAQTGSAKTKYTIEKQVFGERTAQSVQRARYPKRKIAVWNAKHTKVKFYLKDYPNNSWYWFGHELLKHGNTTAKYIYIRGNNKKHTALVQGYVWHGYLEAGYGKESFNDKYLILENFVNNSDYLRYIKKSPTQKITRDIVKLFPNNSVSLKMTMVATSTNAIYYGQIAPPTYFQKVDLSGYKNIVKFPKVVAYLNTSKNVAVKTRVKKVKSILVSYGYTTSKLKKLSKKYQIGINIIDSTYRPDYSASHVDTGYAFVIGERK